MQWAPEGGGGGEGSAGSRERNVRAMASAVVSIHRRAFASAATEFTFVFCGDLPPDAVLGDAFATFLATLGGGGGDGGDKDDSADDDKDNNDDGNGDGNDDNDDNDDAKASENVTSWLPPSQLPAPLGCALPRGVTRRVVRARKAQKSTTHLCFRIAVDPGAESGWKHAVRTVCGVLRTRLLERLRQRLGLVCMCWGGGRGKRGKEGKGSRRTTHKITTTTMTTTDTCSASMSRNSLSPTAVITVSFSTDPEKTEKAIDETVDEIKRLQGGNGGGCSGGGGGGNGGDNDDEIGDRGSSSGSGNGEATAAELAALAQIQLKAHSEQSKNSSYVLFWILDAVKEYQYAQRRRVVVSCLWLSVCSSVRYSHLVAPLTHRRTQDEATGQAPALTKPISLRERIAARSTARPKQIREAFAGEEGRLRLRQCFRSFFDLENFGVLTLAPREDAAAEDTTAGEDEAAGGGGGGGASARMISRI